MAHFTRAQSDATWAGAYTAVRSDYLNVDVNIASAVNGDKGGTWAPTSALTIAGQGITMPGSPLIIYTNGQFRTTGTSRHVISQYPTLGISADTAANMASVGCTGISASPHSGSTRSLVTPFLGAIVYPRNAAVVDLASATLRTTTSTIAISDVSVPPATLNLPLRVHDGATFSSVTVSFKVGTDHSAVKTPRVRVLRVDANGVRTPITLTAPGADALGYVTYVTTSRSWFDSGKVKTMTIPVDTGTVIAIASYTYFVEVLEEDNVHTFPWQLVAKTSVDAASVGSNIYLYGTQTIDGVALTAGMRVLLKDQTYAYQNGIFIVSATQWTRAPDMSTADLCPQGCFVLVKGGTINAGLTYQLTSVVNGVTTWFQAAQAASTGNLTLSGNQTVDNVALVTGQSCLVKNQTNPAENGLWFVEVVAWVRITLAAPTTIAVDVGGTVNGGSQWLLSGTNASPATTDPLVFAQGVKPYGNFWIAATSVFTNIADMRFQ